MYEYTLVLLFFNFLRQSKELVHVPKCIFSAPQLSAKPSLFLCECHHHILGAFLLRFGRLHEPRNIQVQVRNPSFLVAFRFFNFFNCSSTSVVHFVRSASLSLSSFSLTVSASLSFRFSRPRWREIFCSLDKACCISSICFRWWL